MTAHTNRLFAQGNEAIGWGALSAGANAFFGYPITPQNEAIEWFAREFPKRGLTFLQPSSELCVINMVYGAAAAGARVLTSTSSPGWGLMQETMSHLVNAELPCVIVLVQRGGPGQGTVRHAQMDYLSATRGAHGGYKNIVLAPASVQEMHDFVALAFDLADKYRNPAIVLTDGLIGQIIETLEVPKARSQPLPDKDWAVKGTGLRPDGTRRNIACVQGLNLLPPYPTYLALLEHLDAKYQAMAVSEVRCERYLADDAELTLVAYGYAARVCQEAVDTGRQKGMKIGLIRPLTLWPFPTRIIADAEEHTQAFLVVEDSLGQLIDDVKAAVVAKDRVHFLGALARHTRHEMGMILPEAVLNRAQDIHKVMSTK